MAASAVSHITPPPAPLVSLSSPKHAEKPHPLKNRELSRLLKLSVEYADARLCKAAHASILKAQQNTRLFNSLIASYLELGDFNYAARVFESIPSPDVVPFTAMISGLAKSSRENEAVRLFFEMRSLGIEPNGYTFVALLTASMRLLDLGLGSQAHGLAIKTGCLSCSYVANVLMAVYGKCSCFDCVAKVFDEMPERDTTTWNTVIPFLVKDAMYSKAFEVFQSMIVEGFRVDYFTLSCVLVSCTRSFAAMEGMVIHAYAHKTGYESNLVVRNALIDFYAKCGRVKDVEALFNSMHVRDVFTWTEMVNAYMGFGLIDSALELFVKMPERNCVSYNALLSGFCQNGQGLRALRFFCRMMEEGMEISDFTLTSVLHACGLTRDSKSSEQIHALVLKIDFGMNSCIHAALLDMLARCGRMNDAEKVFDRLPLKQSNSVVILTTMICGYARNSYLDKAISLIHRWLCQENSAMDDVALASMLGVCGDLGFQKLGEQFHGRALKHSSPSDVGVGNAVVSMYSRCGDMENASKVFDRMSEHDMISWNSLLSGHILNRQGEKALHVWKRMQKRKINPGKATCVLIISAYRHTSSNSVEQCREFFLTMKSVYKIEPDSDHYASLVGVLGYWGFLEEAEEIIEKMSFQPKASVWRALLDSCGLHKNPTVGKRAAQNILSIETRSPSTYILKSNIYSASGNWQCSERIREEMKARGFQKFPGRSWVIHENRVHSFFGRDKSHPCIAEINSEIDVLYEECLKVGYVPDTRFVLHDVEEHQKTNFLLHHSMKLAVVYGILVAQPGEEVKVFKNVRLCGDCHSFLKCVSVVAKREICVRDSMCFHRFVNGECSCGDYM